MEDSSRCEECGTPIPSHAPQGVCPKCLAALALSFAGPASANPSQAPLGRIRYFGDYELLEEIARGGMGVVYRARQVSLNRIVAVKTLLFGQFASDEFVKRFRTEAEAAASLQHPNIVAIHEVGEHEGQQYFSMEYVAGQSLAGLARDNPLSATRAASYVKTIAEAIRYAHQRGILHRDLKPSNVLIDEFDQPRITDFGLAKQLKGGPDLTVTGQVLGSPNYMPPEQAAPQRGGAGTHSDVYSLGAILYHLLTGRPPFLSDSLEETLRQLLNCEPVAPRLLNASVPRDLETICLKCLEKDPRRRYASAESLAEDLGRWLGGEPIRARPASAPERLWRWCQRQPAVAALGFTVLLLLTFVAIGSTLAAWRIERARRGAVQAESNARAAREETTERLYESYLGQARANRLSGLPGRYFTTMETIAKAVAIRPSVELRNEVIAALAVLDLRLRPLIETNPPAGGGIIFDSNLTLYARLNPQGDVTVRRVADQSEAALIPTYELGVRWLHGFSHDGRYLAFHTDAAGHCVWDLRERRMALRNLPPSSAMLFSPVEDVLVTDTHPDGSISFHELQPGGKIRRVSRVSAGSVAKSFDRTGRRLACFNGATLAAEIFDVPAGVVTAVMVVPDACEAMALSSDGRYLAAACRNGRAYLWDADSGELLQTLIGHDNSVIKVAFNHAGTLLATSGWDDTTRFWDLSGAQLLKFRGWSYQLQFSPDDQQLAYVVAGNKCGLLDLVTHPEYRRMDPSRRIGSGGEMAMSSDGRWIAALVQGQVRFWDQGTGREIGSLPEFGCASVWLAPDGRSLITSGTAGLARWPIKPDAAPRTDVVRLGPRQQAHPAGNGGLLYAAVSSAGDRIAAVVAGPNRAQIFDLENPDQTISLGQHPGMRHISMSPDGHWVATGTWNGSGVRVWEVQSRRLVHEFPEPSHANVLFSPDGRWLVTAGAEYRIWETVTWRPGPPIPQPTKNHLTGVMAFSRDSQFLAIASSGCRAVQLLETKTGRAMAEFESPGAPLVTGLGFNEDSGRLLVSDGLGQIHIWDLRLIRQRLARMNLDWALPPYHPQSPLPPPQDPIRLEVIPPWASTDLELKRIPPRDSHATLNQIDLTAQYNVSLRQPESESQRENSLSNLPAGLQKFDGVTFDVRGIIRLAGDDALAASMPTRVDHIPVGRSCQRLHFLHATGRPAATGNVIGSYVVHYANGLVITIPIVYGHTLRDWWVKGGEPPAPKGLVVAWNGSNAESQANNTSIRLFKWTWENPLPEVEIRNLDFVSALKGCAPFLVAVTAEP